MELLYETEQFVQSIFSHHVSNGLQTKDIKILVCFRFLFFSAQMFYLNSGIKQSIKPAKSRAQAQKKMCTVITVLKMLRKMQTIVEPSHGETVQLMLGSVVFCCRSTQLI